jgi:hypothetical protein
VVTQVISDIAPASLIAMTADRYIHRAADV